MRGGNYQVARNFLERRVSYCATNSLICDGCHQRMIKNEQTQISLYNHEANDFYSFHVQCFADSIYYRTPHCEWPDSTHNLKGFKLLAPHDQQEIKNVLFPFAEAMNKYNVKLAQPNLSKLSQPNLIRALQKRDLPVYIQYDGQFTRPRWDVENATQVLNDFVKSPEYKKTKGKLIEGYAKHIYKKKDIPKQLLKIVNNYIETF